MEEAAANVQLYFGNFSDSQLSEDGEAKELFTKMKAAEKEKELFEDQAIRLNPQGIDLGTKRKGFVELFARGHLGYKNEIRQLEAQIRQLQSQVDRLKCQIGQGEYDILGNQVEQEFREACIAKYKPVKGEEPLLSSIWCPVENRYGQAFLLFRTSFDIPEESRTHDFLWKYFCRGISSMKLFFEIWKCF